MRAAIFRNGEIVVDTHARAEARRRAGAGQDARLRHLRLRPARAQARPSHGRDGEVFSRPQADGPLPRRRVRPRVLLRGRSITVRRPQRRLKPGTRVCSLPALLTPAGAARHRLFQRQYRRLCRAMLLSEALLLEVPNGLAAEHAALTEPLAVGIHAVAKANVRGDEVPLVIGCGPVGLAVIAALENQGLASDRCRRLFAGAPVRWPRRSAPTSSSIPRAAQPYATWAEHAAMSAAEKAARPPLQAFLPALKPALIFECVGVPGLIAAGVRRRAARCPHRRGRRLHGNRPLRADARHHEGTQRPICARLHAGRICPFAAADRGRARWMPPRW